MKIAMCWTNISGYMAACWRALASRPGVQLLVVAYQAGSTKMTSFRSDLLDGMNARLLDRSEQADYECIRSIITDHRPDVVGVAGWLNPAYRRLMLDPALREPRFVIAIDTPFRRDWRQYLARYLLARYVRRAAGIMVAGERSWQRARALGMPPHRIFHGSYGFDAGLFADLHARRSALPGGWPRRFLFVGRYETVKAVDVLLAAYAEYRKSCEDAWGLSCCGSGAVADAIGAAAGVEDLGFVQPAELPEVMVRHGVQVLPSRYEPWGVAVAEALGAGLPVICTEAVGASVELVRPYFNGLIVPTEDLSGLAHAMAWCHRHHDRLATMGHRGQALAAAFSAERWADRWMMMCESVMSRGAAPAPQESS